MCQGAAQELEVHKVAIDKYKCVGCGFCGSICPTGALVSIDFPYTILRNLLEEESEIVFGCTLNGCEGNVLVPCSGAVNEGLLIVSAKDHLVSVNHSKCGKCDFFKGAELTVKRIEALNGILESLGEKNLIKMVSMPMVGIESAETNDSDRRDFIKEIGAGGIGLIQQILPFKSSPVEQKLRLGKKIMPRKHALLINLILDHELPSNESRVTSSDIGLASVEVSEACNGCGMCSTFCPTGALAMEEIDIEGRIFKTSLDFDAKRCLRCDLCIDICPKGAMDYEESFDLGKLFGSGDELVSFEMKKCGKCGEQYIHVLTSSEFCLRCKKEEEIRRHLLGRKKLDEFPGNHSKK
jgi:formate hydrogenlyase subunit 6/NADH:ubiquinone oxidoreductase subunit I/coenzyme F420-reducing hydrogenase delta subunit